MLVFPADNLAGQVQVRPRAGAIDVIDQHRAAMAGGFRHPHVAGNDGGVNLVAEMAAHVGGDHFGQVVAAVEHGQHDALDFKGRVKGLPDPFYGLDQIANAFQGEKFALQGHQHRIGGNQGVQGDQIQGRGTVDQNKVIGGAPGPYSLAGRRLMADQRVAQAVFPAFDIDQFDFGAGQIRPRRHDVQAGNFRGLHRLADGRRADQHLIGVDLALAPPDAQAGAGVALRIQVDEQHPAADGGKRRAQVDRRGGFADPAFLIGDGDDPRPRRPPPAIVRPFINRQHAADPPAAGWFPKDPCSFGVRWPALSSFFVFQSILDAIFCPSGTNRWFLDFFR